MDISFKNVSKTELWYRIFRERSKRFDLAEKTKLVQKDPVTCSRYFDHRVQEFLNTVLKSASGPIGKIQYFFYRLEFQQRGSPHIHMLVWIEMPRH